MLQDEVFGPATLLVHAESREDLLEIARRLDGNLTATILGTADDLRDFSDLVSLLETKVGRLIFNGSPTGGEVCEAMVHGGPYPATSDGRSTSVGGRAIFRFTRPVCFQNFPGVGLPPELQESNPMEICEWKMDDTSDRQLARDDGREPLAGQNGKRSELMPMVIGERLKGLREQKKLSQGDVEKRTGLLRCYISRVENGHTVPSVDTLEKMALALEMPMYRLFTDDAHVKKLNILPQAFRIELSTQRKTASFGFLLSYFLGWMIRNADFCFTWRQKWRTDHETPATSFGPGVLFAGNSERPRANQKDYSCRNQRPYR